MMQSTDKAIGACIMTLLFIVAIIASLSTPYPYAAGLFCFMWLVILYFIDQVDRGRA